MTAHELPLFPLRTVLLPDGPLQLRIFEPRYTDMISDCMRADTGFVVVLIDEGGETGSATYRQCGTLAKIVDWQQYEDGLLGITTVGQSRVRILEAYRQANGLNLGQVEFLPPDPVVMLPAQYQYMARLLERLIGQLGDQYQFAQPDYTDAGWVGCRLAEILPLSNEQKQVCLELTQPLERLDLVAQVIKKITNRNK